MLRYGRYMDIREKEENARIWSEEHFSRVEMGIFKLDEMD
jgi:hypothetical protein